MIRCTACQWAQSVDSYNIDGFITCPSCSSMLHLDVFPAVFRKQQTVSTGEELVVDDHASCFYHPAKQAEIPCEICGRFLCTLCDVEFNSIHMCPSCFESGKTKKKLKSLENHRILYDEMAWALSVIPVALLFTIYFTFITAPMSIYVAIRYWKRPSSIVPRYKKPRLIGAIVLSLFQIGGWGAVIYLIAR